jgi:hypothetical protein
MASTLYEPKGIDGDLLHGWTSILPNRQATRALHRKESSDWLVIGAGFAGLGVAGRLAELRPNDHVILVAGEVGSGASGRNSGFAIDVPHNVGASLAELERTNVHRRLLRAGMTQLKRMVPFLAFAGLTEPTNDEQQARFGKTVRLARPACFRPRRSCTSACVPRCSTSGGKAAANTEAVCAGNEPNVEDMSAQRSCIPRPLRKEPIIKMTTPIQNCDDRPCDHQTAASRDERTGVTYADNASVRKFPRRSPTFQSL